MYQAKETTNGEAGGIEKLREALKLTQMMLDPAREGEWERVQWLESRRQFLLRNWFSQGALPSPEEVQAVLREILEVDREVSSLVASAREESARVLRKVARGRAATRAYRQVEG